MTKVGKLFEEERIQYGEEKLAEGIIGAVSILRNKGDDEGDIVNTLMDTYKLTQSQALTYMNRELADRLTASNEQTPVA